MESGTDSAVSTFSLNIDKGEISLSDKDENDGDDPCYISISPDGLFAATANYSGGSINIFPVNPITGHLMPSAKEIKFTGSGPDSRRQASSHLHCTAFTPDGKYLLATDLGSDNLYVLSYGKEGISSTNSSIQLPSGSGPRHITFGKDGKYAYLLTELSGEVFVINLRKEPFIIQQRIIADTCHARGSADIHISPDGNFLYASTRLEGDGLVTYGIDSASGNVTRISHTPTHRNPRNFAITPDGKYVFVACQKDNLIHILKRDSSTGRLTDTFKTIPVENVSCVKFI